MSVNATGRRLKRAILAMVALAVLGGAVVVAALLLANDFVKRQSRYCIECHEEQSHIRGRVGLAAVQCQTCHGSPPGTLVSALRPLIDPEARMPEHGAVIVGSCMECHQQDEARWHALVATPGHAMHAIDPGPEGCVICHGSAIHGEQVEVACMECHADVPLYAGEADSEIPCIACHSFTQRVRDEEVESAQREGSGRIVVTVENIHGAADCRFCHNPHREPSREASDCRRCHRGAIAASADRLPEAHHQCQSCHFVHARRDERALPCAGCHTRPRVTHVRVGENIVEESTPGLAPELPEPGAGTPAVSLDTLSHDGRCDNCHHPHGEGPWIDACQQCHEERGEAVALLPEGMHTDCLWCHEPHSEPATSAICGTCHGLESSSLMNARRQHRNCLSCHRSHEGRPRPTAVCGACHGQQGRELSTGPERHRRCESCHVEHDRPTSITAAACERCHADQHRSARRHREERHRVCRSCHQEHVFSRATAVTRCATCHQRQGSPAAAHRDACVRCHGPHGPDRPEALACATCHREVRPAVRDHRRCQDCHAPHTRANEVSCAPCHIDQYQWSRGWRPDTPHGGACTSCHPPHNEGSRPTCASCHAEQAGVGHTGTHRLCASCHPTHRPRPEGARGWWGRCRDCHQAESAAAATASPSHRECTSCHDNPRRESPACRQCHQSTVGQMLHTEPRHGRCQDCHRSHTTDRPDRADCVRCHQDRRTHFPDASRCQGCHPFTVIRGGRRVQAGR